MEHSILFLRSLTSFEAGCANRGADCEEIPRAAYGKRAVGDSLVSC